MSSTATSPSAVSCSRTQPRRAGATSSAGRAKKSRASSASLGTARRGPGGAGVHGGPQRGEVLGHPAGGRAAKALARGQRAVDGQHLAHVRGEVTGNLGQVLVA